MRRSEAARKTGRWGDAGAAKEFAIARLPHPSRGQPGEYPPHRAFVCRKARPGPQFRELLLLLGLALRLRLYKDLDRGNLLFQGRVGGVAFQIVQ